MFLLENKKAKTLLFSMLFLELTFNTLITFDNLECFYVETEEDGLKNVTSDLKELNGQYVKISISVVNEEDLSSTGFNSSDE